MNSKLIELIETAVDDCITYGSGEAEFFDHTGTFWFASACWCENEKDIEIAIFENMIHRMSFIERNMA